MTSNAPAFRYDEIGDGCELFEKGEPAAKGNAAAPYLALFKEAPEQHPNVA